MFELLSHNTSANLKTLYGDSYAIFDKTEVRGDHLLFQLEKHAEDK